MAQKRIEIGEHLRVEELKARYLAARDAKEARRWQVLWLIAQGRSTREAAEAVGIGQRTARSIVSRYSARGGDGALDKRRVNPGRRRKLTDEQQGKLLEALRGRAPDGGSWTGPKVAVWIEKETGFKGGRTLGWKTLKRLGARLVVPRRRHQKAADEDEQEAWEDGLARRLERERRDGLLVGRRVEVWAQDEARIGLKPIVRRM